GRVGAEARLCAGRSGAPGVPVAGRASPRVSLGETRPPQTGVRAPPRVGESVMGQYVVRRVLQIVPLVLGITIITFALANLVPGSPISDLEFNPQVRPEDRERIAKALGLDQPLHVRYIQWLSHVARGDLGLSLLTYQPVMKTIMEKLPNTLLLTVTALILSLLIAIPIGVYGAVRRNSAFDQVTTVGAVAGFAMPTFWLGLMVILILVRM